MDNQKLSEALKMSAFLLDADNAGYLDNEETLAVQKTNVDFGVLCQSFALELLKGSDAKVAKVNLISNVSRLKSSIAEVGFESEDTLIFSYLEDHVCQAIDREGAKSEVMRQFSRLILLLPSFFRWLLLAFFIGMMAFAAKDFVGAHM